MQIDWESDGIRLPKAIEQALVDDSLVFFCGAGVSASPPSSLPGFRGLVEKIAGDLGRTDLMPTDPKLPVQFDVVMGELNEIQQDISTRVSRELSPTVTPNSYHSDLLEIFRSQGQIPRIVTTNFDLLFEAAAQQVSLDLPVSMAPALPLGNDFSGLVHLHGPIDPTSGQRMVVTDTDFGRAYITEAWATQFLTRMFERYTVLFIGYSADDTVMHYLARALPADGSKRYAFMEAEQQPFMEAKWSRLGVAAIPYPSPQDSPHKSLQEFIGHWSRRLNATAAERYDHIEAIAQRRQEKHNTSDGDLLWLLNDPEHQRHFLNIACVEDWLEELDELGVLDGLFDPESDAGEVSEGWAHWMSKALKNGHTGVFLAVASRHGGRFSRELWMEVWSYLRKNYEPTKEHRQLLLMLTAGQLSRNSYQVSALLRPLSAKDPEAAEVVLQQLLTPTLRLRMRNDWFSASGSLDTELTLPWKNTLIREAWPSLLPVLSDPDQLLAIVLNLIRSVEATNSLFSGNGVHSALSSTRQQVDGVEEYSRDEPYAIVIDIARDTLREFVRAEGSGRALTLLQSPSEMVRRLAIDALAEAKSAESDKILQLLVEKQFVFNYSTKPEVFRALKAMYRNASLQTKTQLIQHILEAIGPDDEWNIRDYERYNALAWLSDIEVADDPIHSALAAEHEKHPTFAKREHPDLHSWVTTGVSDLDLDAKGLFRQMSPGELVAALGTDDNLDDDFGMRTSQRELHDYLEQVPNQEDKILEQLLCQSLWSPRVWTLVLKSKIRNVKGWGAEALLSSLDKSSVELELIARSLIFPITHVETEAPYSFENALERCRLLLGLWQRTQHTVDTDTSPTDPTSAHETVRGGLAFAYVETVLRTIQKFEEAASNQECLDGLSELVTAQDKCIGDPSPMMVARYAGHILGLVPDWFEQHLRAALRQITNEPQSLSLWAGILSGRLMSSKLRQHVRAGIRIGWKQVADSLPGSTESFIDLHAALFAYDTEAGKAQWADPFIAAAPVETRVRWIRSVARRVDKNSQDVEELLFAHWQRRIDNRTPLRGPEQLALLEWIKIPNIDIDRAVALFVKGPTIDPYDDEHGFDYYRMDNFPRGNASAFLRVAHHLLRGRTTLPHFLKDLLEVLETANDNNAGIASKIWRELLRLGYGPARAKLGPERLLTE